MKLRFTIVFLAAAALGFAQKKEMRKIEKAILLNDFEQAFEVFKSINEAEVEDKYLADYSFYKALAEVDVLSGKLPTEAQVKSSEKYLAKALELGYTNENLVPYLKNIHQRAKYAMAGMYLQNGESDRALNLVKQLYQENTENKDMLFNAANLAYQASKFDEAKEMYRELVGINYNGVVTTYTAVNSATGEVETYASKSLRDAAVNVARTHAQPAEQNSPSNLGDIMNKLMWLYAKDEQIDQAKNLLKKVITNNPDDVSLKAVLPDIYNNLGMIEEYKKITMNGGNEIKDPKVLSNLAKAAYDSKDYEKAIKYYESSISLKGDDFVNRAMLANSYIEFANLDSTSAEDAEKMYVKAVEHLEAANELKPKQANIIGTLKSLYGALGMEDRIPALGQ